MFEEQLYYRLIVNSELDSASCGQSQSASGNAVQSRAESPIRHAFMNKTRNIVRFEGDKPRHVSLRSDPEGFWCVQSSGFHIESRVAL